MLRKVVEPVGVSSPAGPVHEVIVSSVPTTTKVVAKPTYRKTTRIIAILVGLLYFSASLYIFRGVVASIPQVLDGTAVINGDELVPFFNPTSQLIDQAAGKFNQLTNGYEFRVRYAFLTTWMRYYKILPFAIVIVIPSITYAAYLAVSWFLAAALKRIPPPVIYTSTAAPVAIVFLIMTYSKITHFYTLILGFSMFIIAVVLVTYGLIFATQRAYRYIGAAALITLFNPAVHYLILFALYQSISVAVLVLLEAIKLLRSGLLRHIFPIRAWLGYITPRSLWRNRHQILDSTTARAVLSMVLLGTCALLPYGLFVKFIALRGVPNLSETVPGDFYFITDASIPWAHLLALDMAGIMDKMMTGDYLAKEPRYANIVYTVAVMLPLFLPAMRRRVFDTAPRQQFMVVAYVNVFFSMWATLGYSEPGWLPTFHRTIALISRTAYGLESTIGDLVLMLTSTIVQVLRFPHRFELILFMMACILMPISLSMFALWVQEWLGVRARGGATEGDIEAGAGARSQRLRHVAGWAVVPLFAILFMVPLFSSWQYRDTFLSGDMMGFLKPYPVTLLQEVKQELLKRPPGKVVVLPPTESAKVIVDISGVEHKFIDKFHIYYLDLPSFYYGLTGDSDNKFEFFLLLRGLYYQQDWWVNIARDNEIRYIVINRELIANTVGGAEYLREIEKVILPELDQLPEYLNKIYENDSYTVYEFIDLPQAQRIPLFIDTNWSSFIRVLSNDLELTRYYDLRHPVVSDDLTDYESLSLVTDDPHAAALDLYTKAHLDQFFAPSSNIFAFSPDIIPSSYYLSPMFRLFQFFSDSKWNRLNMITPGLYGTIRGSFIGLPRATRFRIGVKFPEDGRYRLLLRGAATANALDISATSLGYEQEVILRAQPQDVSFYDQRTVFTPERQTLDARLYTIEELARLIPTDIVAINNRYNFFDLGIVDATQGSHAFYISKNDNAPLLVEGILAIPEEQYQNLALPANVRLLSAEDGFCCPSLNNDEAYPIQ